MRNPDEKSSVFLGAGLVLLAAGTRYARLVTTAAEEPGTLAPHDGDGAQRSSTGHG